MWTSVITLVVVIINHATSAADPLDRFLGNNALQIGFGNDCYMFWRGDVGNRKNMEFRCGKSKGDLMKIVKDGDGYRIGSTKDLWLFANFGLFFRNAEFRRSMGTGEKLWIKPQGDGLFAIGYHDCPLIWQRNNGLVKNGVFRCGRPVSDTFWIKGADSGDCMVTNVTVLSTDVEAEHVGTKVIGINVGASCSDSQSAKLPLANLRTITETVSFTIRNTKKLNFGFSDSITIKAGGNILGVKSETIVTKSFSIGGTISWSGEETHSVSTTNKSLPVPYSTPGAAMSLGLIKRYKFNEEKLPARYLVQCKGGHQFTYDSTIALKSKAYGQAHFSNFIGTYLKDKCTEDVLHCLDGDNFNELHDVNKAKEHFKSCFPLCVGKVLDSRR